MRILIAYATKYGSTKGIAERIAAKLTDEGLDVDIETVESASIETAGDLAQYDAFVIGSAVFAAHWMKPAARFIRDFSQLLASRPVWLFSVGPLGPKQAAPMKPRDFDENTAAVGAREHRVFYGAMDVARLRGADRLLSLMFKSTQGEFRDWDEIESWAMSIARELPRQTSGLGRSEAGIVPISQD